MRTAYLDPLNEHLLDRIQLCGEAFVSGGGPAELGLDLPNALAPTIRRHARRLMPAVQRMAG